MKLYIGFFLFSAEFCQISYYGRKFLMISYIISFPICRFQYFLREEINPINPIIFSFINNNPTLAVKTPKLDRPCSIFLVSVRKIGFAPKYESQTETYLPRAPVRPEKQLLTSKCLIFRKFRHFYQKEEKN